MTATLQQLIDSLRNELQQYGEMLALLEAQQESVACAGPAANLSALSAVAAQRVALQASRQAREKAQRQLAWSLSRPEDHRFEQLLPLLPEDYRPLVSALVQEIDHLLQRVRERAHCNQEHLRLAVVLMERFLQSLSPEALSARSSGELTTSRADPEPPLAASAFGS